MGVASTMMALGTEAPDFDVPDVRSGERISLATFAGAPALLVMFICRHCPYVVHVRPELSRLAHDYRHRGAAMLALSSNDARAYPDDRPESLAEMAHGAGFDFPFGYDESQDVARAYGAACTPDFFLFDAARRLSYRGQLDDSRPGNGRPVDGTDLRNALDAVLDGRPVFGDQKPSVGCGIKWRPAD